MRGRQPKRINNSDEESKINENSKNIYIIFLYSFKN